MTRDDRLLELLGDTHDLMELDEFRVEVLAALRRAVPADWASLNDIALTACQAEVLRLVAAGLSERDIADRSLQVWAIFSAYERKSPSSPPGSTVTSLAAAVES